MPNSKFTLMLCNKKHRQECSGVGSGKIGNETVRVFCVCPCHKKPLSAMKKKKGKMHSEIPKEVLKNLKELAKSLKKEVVKIKRWQKLSSKESFLLMGEDLG